MELAERATGLRPANISSITHGPGAPNTPSTATVGLLRDTILPSFGLHSGLSLVAYGLSRATNRVDGKDWLWPSAQVLNAWYSAVIMRMRGQQLSFSDALHTLSWNERLLLGAVTTWGVRLFYRVASRSIKRGKDDSRYEGPKKKPGFWNEALWTLFIPEAVFQTLITIPFTVPFRNPQDLLTISTPIPEGWGEVMRAVAVGLFCAGAAMEILADRQLENFKKRSANRDVEGLQRDGVWSIVRHPNYLGDALTHISFALFVSSRAINPLLFVGPLANYIFLRYVGGDRENETSQEERYKTQDQEKYYELLHWRTEKNSFWPKLREFSNPWMIALGGIGGLGVLAERYFRP